FRQVGISVVVALVVCGWYYFWVWLNFGTPLVGNWDVRSGFAWWQDHGYQAAAYFKGFGRTLINPWSSGMASFWDGLYSTLWGDGLLSGAGERSELAPWNWDLMAAGYWLAVVPTMVALAGAGACLWQLVRHVSAEWLMLLGLAASLLLAILFMSLKVPSV